MGCNESTIVNGDWEHQLCWSESLHQPVKAEEHHGDYVKEQKETK